LIGTNPEGAWMSQRTRVRSASRSRSGRTVASTHHATCAPSYFGTREALVKRIELAGPDLPKPDLAELSDIIAKAPEVLAVERETAAEDPPKPYGDA
jgi:hypothetical protein